MHRRAAVVRFFINFFFSCFTLIASYSNQALSLWHCARTVACIVNCDVISLRSPSELVARLTVLMLAKACVSSNIALGRNVCNYPLTVCFEQKSQLLYLRKDGLPACSMHERNNGYCSDYGRRFTITEHCCFSLNKNTAGVQKFPMQT